MRMNIKTIIHEHWCNASAIFGSESHPLYCFFDMNCIIYISVREASVSSTYNAQPKNKFAANLEMIADKTKKKENEIFLYQILLMFALYTCIHKCRSVWS